MPAAGGQIPISKLQIPSAVASQAIQDRPQYDLEERTFQFAKTCTIFCRSLSRSLENVTYIKQLVRSSGSVGANYIEANESLGEKDFALHIKICRKETKESAYWLRLIAETNDSLPKEVASKLIQEATELRKIFSAILKNYQSTD